ncbi:hypothetical protein MHYP_G00151020 [Metynnis hypsauchen]
MHLLRCSIGLRSGLRTLCRPVKFFYTKLTSSMSLCIGGKSCQNGNENENNKMKMQPSFCHFFFQTSAQISCQN